MGKLQIAGLIVVAVIMSYLVLTASMPAINELTSTANASRADWSDYDGAQEGLNTMPLVIYILPGAIGAAAIIITLKSRE